MEQQDDAGKIFMQLTKYMFLKESDQSSGRPQPPLEEPAAPDQPVTALPDPTLMPLPPLDFRGLLGQRQSVRDYRPEPLTLEELSFLLWATQGVKQVYPERATLRTVPSAGARHAFDTYLVVNRVAGLQPGLYRYLALTHQLAAVDLQPDLADKVAEGCLGQPYFRKAAVTFLWAAVRYRMTWRYGERGYRYLLMDVGHVCQNLYLAAEAIGCGTVGIAAFDDDALDRFLNLDGACQFVIYLAPLGKKLLKSGE